jgi:hypothetical protein
MKRLSHKKTVSPVGTHLEKSNTKYDISLIKPLLLQGLGAKKKDTAIGKLANRLKYVKQKSIIEGNSSIGAEQRYEDRWAISRSFDKVPVYSTFKLLITDLGFTRPLFMAGVELVEKVFFLRNI